jgi:hypothetical protein
MKTFQDIDPLTIKQNPAVVGSLLHNRKPTITYYVLIVEDYALIAVCDWFTDGETGESEWLTYQLEMPKSGIAWIVDTLENKFFKLSHEGGLPADVRHYEEMIEGEKLGIGREMGLGSNDNREAGYSFITMSRPEPGEHMGKELSFTDSFLFEHGFFELLKSTAQKIKSGAL